MALYGTNSTVSHIPVLSSTGFTYRTRFGKPTEIGYFSVDSRRNIHFDRSQMKYYVPRSNVGLELDLNAGYWRTIQKEFDVSEKMEQVERWIAHHNYDAVIPETGHGVDFVTSRGALQCLLHSPFSSEAWCLCASRVHNTIYFGLVDTDSKVLQRSCQSAHEKLMISWGYKFEQYMTSDIPHGAPNMQSVQYQLEEFSIVLKNDLNGYTLLYKAEIDAVKSGRIPGYPSSYVELKTSRNSPPYYSDPNFGRNKALRWWAQSHLAGVEEIICGFRDSEGIVRSIETFYTSSLAGYGGAWDPNTCFEFCNSFLNVLKSTVVENDHRVVYKFDFRGGSTVSCQRLVSPEIRYQVVPEWYASALTQKLRKQHR